MPTAFKPHTSKSFWKQFVEFFERFILAFKSFFSFRSKAVVSAQPKPLKKAVKIVKAPVKEAPDLRLAPLKQSIKNSPEIRVAPAIKNRPEVAVVPKHFLAPEPPILFYDKAQPHYHFTNFAPSSFKDEKGFFYPTAEHYFQAQKFLDPLIAKRVREANSPREVFALANGKNGQYASYIRKEWHSLSKFFMLEAQLYKYAQNPALLKALLGTGNALLIEDAGAKDAIWGNGQKGELSDAFGENRLGKILMAVRSAFRKAIEADDFEQTVQVTFKGNHTLIHKVNLTTELGFNLSDFVSSNQRAPGVSR